MAAFNKVLGKCVDGEHCAALLAKLQLIRQERETKCAADVVRIRNAAVARGVLGSSATGCQLWDVAVGHADDAVGAAITACFDVGVTDVEAIGEAAGEDAKAFLVGFAQATIQPGYQDLAAQMIASALTKPTQARRRAVAMHFDRKKTPQMSKHTTITIQGGNVQIGDGNSQTISYQTFLANLADAVEKSPDAPAEKKAAWATALKELAAHPLTQTLISAAAGAATGA